MSIVGCHHPTRWGFSRQAVSFLKAPSRISSVTVMMSSQPYSYCTVASPGHQVCNILRSRRPCVTAICGPVSLNSGRPIRPLGGSGHAPAPSDRAGGPRAWDRPNQWSRPESWAGRDPLRESRGGSPSARSPERCGRPGGRRPIPGTLSTVRVPVLAHCPDKRSRIKRPMFRLQCGMCPSFIRS